jgi:nitroreductase
MFNDTSGPAALLATRRSGKPRDMVAPGPDAAQLDAILATAIRVPDHGKLAPWRIVVVDADRRAAFAAMLRAALLAEKPTANAKELEAADQFAHQAPALVAVLSAPVHGKIELWEQELSAGALCMNLLAATHAAGFVGGWLTTWAAYSPTVRDALGGGPDDRIAGFMFIGTPSRPLDERPRPAFDSVVTHWRD